MSLLSAHFFSYVQGAAFYRELHRRAVELLPPGAAGDTWLDAGCGPGLVARLAAAHGYQAVGFDIDFAMIWRARTVARHEASLASYEIAGIDELSASGRKASVVSAASLLAVLNDKDGVLQQLMSCLNDDGILLLVETTGMMKPRIAWAWLRKNGFGNRNWILLLWAWARRNGKVVTPTDMHLPGCRVERVGVFEGMVDAWLIRYNPMC